MSSRAWSKLPIGFMAGVGLLLAAGPAAAQVQSQTLQVQARIGEVCTVTSASLDFGQALDTEVDTDASGSIDIDCEAETDLSVNLDGGLLPSGTNRNMTQSGSDPILYLLFKDSQRSEVWNPGEQVATTISGSGSVPVYGTVPSQGDGRSPGLYTDEITITLVF